MTQLFITSTYHSDIQRDFNKELANNFAEHKVCQDLIELNSEMVLKHFSDKNELSRKPFSPEYNYIAQAKNLLLPVEEELVLWCDSDTSLLLKFWHQAATDAKFILFYTSPEYELSKYMSSGSFSSGMAHQVISAWCIRTSAMLDFYQNHKNISLLVNLRYIESNRVELSRLIKERFSIELAFKPHKAEAPYKSTVLIDYLSTTLLLNNPVVSEAYDEVRSAATIIVEKDKEIADIRVRNNALITEFLSTVNSYTQLIKSQKEMVAKLSLGQLQINQLTEELEHYFRVSEDQANQNKTMLDYLALDPLLKIARQARKSQ